MVISDRKPMAEILGFLKDAKKVILVGCNQCAAASKTGGEPEIQEMKALLEAEGKEVLGYLLPDTACNLLLGKKEFKSLKNELKDADAILSLACGECELGWTGGICPVTMCAKGLINGACGGAKNGKCEVDPENDCAWVKIYERLRDLNQLDNLLEVRAPKDYSKQLNPRRHNANKKAEAEA